MVQKEIIINDVKVPIIEEGGETWYPIKFVIQKVLLKETNVLTVEKQCNKYVKQFKINYGFNTGGIQLSKCTNDIGLKVTLKNSRLGSLSLEQKRAMNGLLQYLGMETIIEDERFIKTFPKEKILEYSEYIQDCINEILINEPNILWQKCNQCNNYYPYHINFFRENPHSGKEYKLYTFCRDCCGWSETRSKDWIRCENKKLSIVYREGGKDTYLLYKNHDVIGIYNDWINKQYRNHIPSIIHNKNDYLNIIKYLHDKDLISKDNLIMDILEDTYKLTSISHFLKINEIYEYLYGNDPINHPWKYKNFDLSSTLSIEQQKQIFNNYIQDNNIMIDDIYKFNYSKICLKCGLARLANINILDFIVKYYNNKYPAYKFDTKSKKYWTIKENRILNLQFLIEEDMKISIEKIPLYLTLENLRKQSNTLRNLLRKYYNNNIYLWVNEIYPNRFDEEDFNVTVIRNIFDSAEESLIHDILINKFKNVLYNQRGTKNTITIMGMQPDWFIFTNKGLWIIEYFGISVDNKEYNQRIKDYNNKTLSKIKRYKELDWLRTIYVYPEDLKDNFKGLDYKLNDIE